MLSYRLELMILKIFLNQNDFKNSGPSRSSLQTEAPDVIPKFLVTTVLRGGRSCEYQCTIWQVISADESDPCLSGMPSHCIFIQKIQCPFDA